MPPWVSLLGHFLRPEPPHPTKAFPLPNFHFPLQNSIQFYCVLFNSPTVFPRTEFMILVVTFAPSVRSNIIIPVRGVTWGWARRGTVIKKCLASGFNANRMSLHGKSAPLGNGFFNLLTRSGSVFISGVVSTHRSLRKSFRAPTRIIKIFDKNKYQLMPVSHRMIRRSESSVRLSQEQMPPPF